MSRIDVVSNLPVASLALTAPSAGSLTLSQPTLTLLWVELSLGVTMLLLATLDGEGLSTLDGEELVYV